MSVTLRYLAPCLAALAAACGQEGSDPDAPDMTAPQRAAAVEAITAAPALRVDAHVLYYCYSGGNRYCMVLKHQVRITSSGAALKWTASKDKPWLLVSPVSGTTPSTVTVSVDPRTFDRFFNVPGHVTITAAGASNSPQTIVAEVNRGIPPALAFSDSAIGFCYYPTGTRACVKLEEAVLFSSTGPALAWRAVSSVPWIILRPASGTTPTTVRVSVDLTKVQFHIGTSVSGSITVSSGAAWNTPQTIPVKLQFYNLPLPR